MPSRSCTVPCLSMRPCLLIAAALLQDEDGEPVAGPEFSAELAAELDQYGAAVGAPGQWASCVRIVDPAGERLGGGIGWLLLLQDRHMPCIWLAA